MLSEKLVILFKLTKKNLKLEILLHFLCVTTHCQLVCVKTVRFQQITRRALLLGGN